MRTRFMRIMVFFDLPVTSEKNRKDYATFRKSLIKNGFVMMQNSVYSKVALNPSVDKSVKDKIHKIKPPEGLIQVLVITEKQFASIEYILGEHSSNVVEDTERLVVL